MISGIYSIFYIYIPYSSIEDLFYNILSEMIEQVLTAVELTITDLEEKSLTDPEKETLSHLDRLSRQLIVFRRHFWRVIDVVNFLTHIEVDKNVIIIIFKWLMITLHN